MENFRNKQWFKELTPEQKQEICKKFDINEQTLKKCGRKNSDGKIVIDLLRIDHMETVPDQWKIAYKILKESKFDYTKYESNINLCIDLYKLFHDDKLLKYKDTLHNRVLLEDRIRFIKFWLDMFNSSDDVSDKEFCAIQVCSHITIIIKSDLNLVKDDI